MYRFYNIPAGAAPAPNRPIDLWCVDRLNQLMQQGLMPVISVIECIRLGNVFLRLAQNMFLEAELSDEIIAMYFLQGKMELSELHVWSESFEMLLNELIEKVRTNFIPEEIGPDDDADSVISDDELDADRYHPL